MADTRDIVNLVQARVKRILDYAELAVPANKIGLPHHSVNAFNDVRGTCE
jgi:hypothetical protein